MDRILYCLTIEHDWRWTLAAAVLCIFGLGASFRLLVEARRHQRARRREVALLGAVVGGVAVFSTHFVAMQGYDAGGEVRYGLVLTLLSLVLGVGGVALGSVVALFRNSRLNRGLGGMVGLSGVAAMHFVGVAALDLPGRAIGWDPVLAGGAVVGGLAMALVTGALIYGKGRPRVAGPCAAGALAIAGLQQDGTDRRSSSRRLVAVACGANMNFDRLRFIAERSELGEDREAMLAVEIPEQPGSLRSLCDHLRDRSLTEFSYRMSEGPSAHIFIGVQVNGEQDRQQLVEGLDQQGFSCLDLSDNELSKVHLRHMVGGRLPSSSRTSCAGECLELLYRFEFPERPGALMRFVSALNPGWSISIFHYRNHGADVGRIVVGVLIPVEEQTEWNAFLKNLGYRCWDETKNPAYTLFL